MTTERGLTVIEHGDIVRPAVTVQQALDAWKEYQEMKAALATPDDQQEIQGRVMLKKSYWRKVGRFYKLNTELLKEWHEDREDGTRIFYATYRAIHPQTGAFCDGDGADFAIDINEFHNARATAHTRAKNRAISDLVGGGEVSAEEASGGGKGSSRTEIVNTTEHYCAEHKVNYFKRGKMRGYAHKIGDTAEWCTEPEAPKAKAPEVIDGKAKDVTPPAQAADGRAAALKEIVALVKTLGMDNDAVKRMIGARYMRPSTKEMTDDEVQAFRTFLAETAAQVAAKAEPPAPRPLAQDGELFPAVAEEI